MSVNVAAYYRAKLASETQNNIGNIKIMSVAEVSKDPDSSALNKLAAHSKRDLIECKECCTRVIASHHNKNMVKS
jgi:hypothetical protein